jgi:hypothetical protein
MKTKNISRILAISFIAIAMLLVAACTNNAPPSNENTNTPPTTTTTTPPPEHVSFSDILNTKDKSIKQVNIRGYLKEEQVPLEGRMNAFSDNYYVTDDDNNKVELSFVDPNSIMGNANTELEKYFTTNETTAKAFSITGELQWNLGDKPIIFVKTIN